MDKDIDYMNVGIFIVIIILLLGFVFYTVVSGDSDSEEEDIDEIKEELLEGLDKIDQKLDDVENVPEK